MFGEDSGSILGIDSTYLNVSFDVLAGKTIIAVDSDDENILFLLEGRQILEMTHRQDCCESVYVSDISGNWGDIVGSTVQLANEESNYEDNEWGDSTTWTFYKLSTVKGHMTITWRGESNGYYSEEVDCYLHTLDLPSLMKKPDALKKFFDKEGDLELYILQAT